MIVEAMTVSEPDEVFELRHLSVGLLIVSAEKVVRDVANRPAAWA